MMHSTCNQHGTSMMATTPGAVFANFTPILPLFCLGCPQLLVAIFAIGWHITFQKLKTVAWQCQTGPLFWPKEARCALFLVLGPPWGQQSPNLQITGPPSRATPCPCKAFHLTFHTFDSCALIATQTSRDTGDLCIRCFLISYKFRKSLSFAAVLVLF